MVQHIVETCVEAGDTLYFHVNKNETTFFDTLHYDPQITYAAKPKFTLDRAQLVMGPEDFARIGAMAMDSSLSVVPNETNFDFFHSGDYGMVTQRFRGELDRPGLVSVYGKYPFRARRTTTRFTGTPRTAVTSASTC